MAGNHVTGDSRSRFFRGKNVHIEKKEWGEEHWIVNKEYCGKKLILRKGFRCSLHKHRQKDEVFYLQSGKVLLELGKDKYALHPGDFVHVPAGEFHRFTGLELSEIFESSTHHEEDDSYRQEFSGHTDPVRYERQLRLLDHFAGKRIVVIGDVMLDAYLAGRIERISPEAPIPVVRAEAHLEVPGGAANVAAGLRALGADVSLIGISGADDTGKKLERLLRARGIRTALQAVADRPTTRKERITALSGQQIVRVDVEATDPISSTTEKKLIAALKSTAKKADAILLSDYAKGVLTPAIFKAAYAAGRAAGIPVIVDPKPHGTSFLAHLKKADAVTPNVAEARHLLGEQKIPETEIGPKLSRALKGGLVLTRGGKGMDVYRKGKLLAHFDALSPEVVDVSGAGDTVAAAVTLVLACHGALQDAADIGNRAASVAVGKRGTATVDIGELRSAL